MRARFCSSVFLIFLFCLPGVVAWCQELVQIEDVNMPELVWNTNTVRITLRNPAAQPKTIVVDVQTSNHRGIGWRTEHLIAAGEKITIDREFLMPPFPGKARAVVTILEKGGPELCKRKFDTEFPLENRRIAKLLVPQVLMGLSPYGPLSTEYPPLERARRGHFIFYYPENFAYVRTHLTVLAKAREHVYMYLQKTLNPAFHDDVAVYLFPDEPTKFAYTGHQGRGWAFDHVLVEVLDPLHPKDPERIDPNHELVHIMTASLGDPPAMFNEGLAVYLQVGHKWQDHPLYDWARSFDAAGMLMPIRRLFALEEIGPKGTRAWVTYPESASMIQFLIKHYGFGKVMEAFRELKSGAPEQENAAVFDRIFGVSLDAFDKNWHDSLRKGNGRIPPELIDDVQKKIVAAEKE